MADPREAKGISRHDLLFKVGPLAFFALAGGAALLASKRTDAQPQQRPLVPTRSDGLAPRPTNSDGTRILTGNTATPEVEVINRITPEATNPVSTAEATTGRHQATNQPGATIDTGMASPAATIDTGVTPNRVEWGTPTPTNPKATNVASPLPTRE